MLRIGGAQTSRRKASNELRAKIFNTLSDPATLRVLEALFEGEAPTDKIAKAVGMEDTVAASHLGKLREGRLATVRRVGAYSYYRVPDVPSVDKILASVDDMLMKIEEMRRRGIEV